MQILNKNGISFTVPDNTTELRVKTKFKYKDKDVDLDLVIMEEMTILINSSKSEIWDDPEYNPFLDTYTDYIYYDNNWYEFYDGRIKHGKVVDLEKIKSSSYTYSNMKIRDYWKYNGCNALRVYKAPNGDDKIYDSFEEALYDSMHYNVKLNTCDYKKESIYDTFDIDKILNFTVDSEGNKLSNYYKGVLNIQQAIENKYDIALVKDEHGIENFKSLDSVKKIILSQGKGDKSFCAIAYCDVETGHTIIDRVDNHDILCNVIYDELDTYNIASYGYKIYNENLNKFTKMKAINIANDMMHNGNTKVFTSNTSIAYRLITGKNIKGTCTWVDENGDNIKKYFNKKSSASRTTVTKTSTTKIEGVQEILNEELAPIVDSLEKLHESIESLVDLYSDDYEDNKDVIVPVLSLDNYKKASFDENVVNQSLRILKRRGQLLLHGAPGVGKTYLAKYLAYKFTGSTQSDKITVISCSSATDYGSCIEGLSPRLNGGWVESIGTVYKALNNAIDNPDSNYIVILDETNRCKIYDALGEIWNAMEARGDYVKTANGRNLMVPKNIAFIGIINTNDSGITDIPNMIKSRFARIEIKNNKVDVDKVSSIPEVAYIWDKVEQVNEIISREHGNSYIVGIRQISYNINSLEDLEDDLETGIIPCIEDNINRLSKASALEVNRLIGEMRSILKSEETL